MTCSVQKINGMTTFKKFEGNSAEVAYVIQENLLAWKVLKDLMILDQLLASRHHITNGTSSSSLQDELSRFTSRL